MRFYFKYDGMPPGDSGVDIPTLAEAERQAGQVLLASLAEKANPFGTCTMTILGDGREKPLAVITLSLVNHRL